MLNKYYKSTLDLIGITKSLEENQLNVSLTGLNPYISSRLNWQEIL